MNAISVYDKLTYAPRDPQVFNHTEIIRFVYIEIDILILFIIENVTFKAIVYVWQFML